MISWEHDGDPNLLCTPKLAKMGSSTYLRKHFAKVIDEISLILSSDDLEWLVQDNEPKRTTAHT